MPLNRNTAMLARGYAAVCVFVNDLVGEEMSQTLGEQGVRLVAMRCAGFNNVNLKAAAALGIKVVRVSAYSPYSVAEHILALILHA